MMYYRNPTPTPLRSRTHIPGGDQPPQRPRRLRLLIRTIGHFGRRFPKTDSHSYILPSLLTFHFNSVYNGSRTMSLYSVRTAIRIHHRVHQFQGTWGRGVAQQGSCKALEPLTFQLPCTRSILSVALPTPANGITRRVCMGANSGFGVNEYA